MSKFQPRIFINNPEKEISDKVVEQFYLTIKSGDIEKIREFVFNNKNKFNLVEKPGKSRQSTKSPLHIVMELDDKTASIDTKYKIISFLEEMGTPLDLLILMMYGLFIWLLLYKTIAS